MLFLECSVAVIVSSSLNNVNGGVTCGRIEKKRSKKKWQQSTHGIKLTLNRAKFRLPYCFRMRTQSDRYNFFFYSIFLFHIHFLACSSGDLLICTIERIVQRSQKEHSIFIPPLISSFQKKRKFKNFLQ